MDRGEVALDQPLATLIPEAASHRDGRPITLADLATHTSGLPRLPPGLIRQALRNRQDPYADFTTAQLIQALERRPKQPPGVRVRYSNFGFGVLAEAVSRATGTSYPDLVRLRIAAPLDLRDTGVLADGSEERAASGHTRRGRPTGDWNMGALAGAGALRSSTRDLLIFLGAHLAPETTRLAAPIRAVLAPRARIGRPLWIGLGWHVLDRKGGARWWWHNGGTGGFASFVGFDPGTASRVVVLGNSARPVDRLGQVLLEPAGGSLGRSHDRGG